MPWPPKQRTAIFLSVKRKKGLAAAKKVMHEAGYGGHQMETASGGYKKFIRNRRNDRFVQTPVPNENSYPANMGQPKRYIGEYHRMKPIEVKSLHQMEKKGGK